LGEENILAGKNSMYFGMLLVVLFMFFYYRIFGFIANIALFANLIIIIAILSVFQATLTLSGIAGIVLTVGMAVDANVLIFERIREEILNGNSPNSSIYAGYKKAFSTISDANITTLIAAISLLTIGTGVVKGFAVTLVIGILSSMFTSIIGTRAIVSIIYENKKQTRTLNIMIKIFKNVIDYNFIQKRFFALILSGTLIVLSLGSFLYQGINWGIDFSSGYIVQLKFQDNVEIDNLSQKLSKSNLAKPVLQYYGSKNEVIVKFQENSFVNEKNINEFLLQNLEDQSYKLMKLEFVGSQIGSELRDKGEWAMLVALLSILVYIGFRFEFLYGIGAIFALIHDVIITVGIFSLIQLEFDLSVLSAILAVIGYSLNDTIVVFDRIRENTRTIRESSFMKILNISINQTLNRTVVTSLTTLFVLVSLLLLGGIAVTNFAIAMIVGVLIGTYSSIFVAGSSLIYLGVQVQSEDQK